MQTSTHNDHLFHQPSGSSPRYREEATTSHWVNAPRENFTARTQVKHQERMARSKGAMQAQGITVGWSLPKSRQSL